LQTNIYKKHVNPQKMVKDPHKNDWKFGEIVTLPREKKTLKKSGSNTYEQLIESRYVCIREATEEQRGILAKVLGEYKPERIMMVNRQPFSKDGHENLFYGVNYFSYPFPAKKDVIEALDIIRNDQSLIQQFKKLSVHLNLQAKFWVSETASRLLVMKKPLCYDASSDELCTASNDDAPYRLTLAFFHNGELYW